MYFYILSWSVHLLLVNEAMRKLNLSIIHCNGAEHLLNFLQIYTFWKILLKGISVVRSPSVTI